MLALAVACGTRPDRPEANGDSAVARAALRDLTALAMQVPNVAAILAPRDDAFVRAADDVAEDVASRGRIVSEGWRATKAKKFAAIGARLPDAADGEMDVGPSRFARLHLRVTLEGTSRVPWVVDPKRKGRQEMKLWSNASLMTGSRYRPRVLAQKSHPNRSFATTTSIAIAPHHQLENTTTNRGDIADAWFFRSLWE